MKAFLAVCAASAALVCGCAETPLWPADSPANPASTAAPEAAGDAPSVLAKALPAVGAPPAIAPSAAPAMDPSHHHHHHDMAPEAAPAPGEAK